MFDAVDAAVERRRSAIADRRSERCMGIGTEDKRLSLNSQSRGRLLQRKRTLLDRGGKETHRHRTAIELAAFQRDEACVALAIGSCDFLQRAMVGGLRRFVHRLAISNARRPRTVQTDEDRHEHRKEPGFERMLAHHQDYVAKVEKGDVTFVTFAKSITQIAKR